MSNTQGQANSEFVYFSNRGSRIFRHALEPLGGREYLPGDSHIDLLYFDTFGGKQPPIGDTSFTLIDRQRTIPLDNKAQMTAALMQSGRHFPRVYYSPDQVPAEPGSLWFIKSPLRSAGKGTSVVHYENLAKVFRSGNIIEEAVQDLCLIAGRKFTLRFYLLAHGGKLYFYPDGIVVLHGSPYAAGSCDPQVQFLHDGYMDPDSPVTMYTPSVFPQYEEVLPGCAELALWSFRVFGDFLKYEPAGRYCLFGIDVLIRSDLTAVIVEINDRPNIVHTKEINQGINIPMVRALYAILDPSRESRMDSGAVRFAPLGEL